MPGQGTRTGAIPAASAAAQRALSLRQQHLETWLAQCRDGHDDPWSVPEHVPREFRRYLECGILAHGFARARCGQCGHDFLIAFSCYPQRETICSCQFGVG